MYSLYCINSYIYIYISIISIHFPFIIHCFSPSSLILFNPCSSILIKSFHACSIFPFPSSFHPFFILFSFLHQCLPKFIHCHPLFIHISSIFLSISIHFSCFIIGVHQFLLLFPSSFHPFFILFSFLHQCLPNFIHCHPLFIHISSIFLSVSIHFSCFIVGVHQFLLLLCFPPFIIQ